MRLAFSGPADNPWAHSESNKFRCFRVEGFENRFIVSASRSAPGPWSIDGANHDMDLLHDLESLFLLEYRVGETGLLKTVAGNLNQLIVHFGATFGGGALGSLLEPFGGTSHVKKQAGAHNL